MQLSRSPPKSKYDIMMGGSKATSLHTPAAAQSPTDTTLATSGNCALSTSSLSPLQGGNSTCRTGSTLSLYSNSSTTPLLSDGGNCSRSSCGETTNLKSTNHSHHHSYSGAGGVYHHHPHHHQHHYHQHSHSHGHHYGDTGGGGSGSSSRGGSHHRSSVGSSTSSKRGKKNNWGSRERAGMSFLIVIAFFAVFGLIILTELFMIDEKTHGGMIVLRHGNQGNRLGDSMPDYDNVKDDYDLLGDSLLSDSKLGFIQFHDNKLKIQDASNGDAGRQAGVLLNSPNAAVGYGVGAGIGGGGGGGSNANNVPIIPWGKVLPAKIEETLPHYPIGMTPTDGSWQVVNGTRFKFFVFSAYYDRRDGAKLVRVIGATKTRGPERVWCRFWYASHRNGTGSSSSRLITPPRYTSATVMARVKIIRENWNLKYSACFILCPIRAPELDIPQYVSVVSRLRAPPGNFLELRNTDWDADFATPTNHSSSGSSNHAHGGIRQKPLNSSAASAKSFSPLPTGDQIADKIAICVKPFHFNYDQALYLMEYLEFYALMGVSHFTFYNHTTGPHATCVLQHYMSGDVPGTSTVSDVEYNSVAAMATNANAEAAATSSQQQQEQHRISTNYVKPTINILPWNLRMRSQKEIRTEGLFAALNDCLYRTMYRYKYLALVDLDEFIIPRHNDTLNELINSLNARFRNRNTGAYSFQNAFFYLQFADDPLVYQEPEKSLNPRLRAALVTQRKTRRRFKLHPQKQRSKYICKPEAVIEAGNHFVWEFSPGKGSLNVPPTDAILHHYRVCEFGGNDCIKAPSTIDRTATKYANRLLQRVDAVYNYLKGPCNLPELPELPKQPPAIPIQPVVSAVANALKPTKTRITKLFNDFKSKLRETLNRGDTANHNERNQTLTNATRSGAINTNTKSLEKSAAKSIKTSSSNASRTPNADYVSFKEQQQHKVVVFEQDEDGQTVVKVKYLKKGGDASDKMHRKN